MILVPSLEKIVMQFLTFTLIKASFPSFHWGEWLEIYGTSCKYESSPGLPPDIFLDQRTLINPPTQLVWKEEVGGKMISFFYILEGGLSEVLDPWTGSAVLNILSTVCLPSADLPDMLSSRLAGDATSLRISPATREAPLHFLWINSHTVGEEERPGHMGTGAGMRRKHTHSFSEEQHTHFYVQYELPWSKHDESCESTQWIETTWNLYFNYSFTVYKVCSTETGQSRLRLYVTRYELNE